MPDVDGPTFARRAAADTRAIAVVVTAFAVAYSLYGLFRHWQFGTSAYDLGIFDQAIWHLSRFEAPASTIRGFSNLMGDHFFPIIALFAPLYWIAPRPEALIVAQAALIAASIVPVFLFMRDRLPAAVAMTLAVAYGLFWGLQRTIAFDVHEAAFAPLAIATAILAMDRRQWRLFWVAVAAMVLIKEDMIPLLTGFGVYLMITGERRAGALLTAGSIVVFIVVIAVVIPFFNNESGTYGYASAYGNLLSEPWRIPATLVTPAIKLQTVLLWFAPFLFLSFASPIALLVIPLAAERFLSSSPTHWTTLFHYSAPLAPIIAMSAADGLARLRPYLNSRVTAPIAAVSLVLCAVLPGRLPLWRVFAPEHYAGPGRHATGPAALALVPGDASVTAQAAIAPHLSRRRTIFMLDAQAPEAEYVVAADTLSPWPAASVDELRAWVEDRRRRGYTTIFEMNGWTVLRRSTPSTEPSTSTDR
jgi:uncharacterized membrane protein